MICPARTVEYYFECTFGSGHSRGWSTDPNYIDTGLTTGQQYGYRVKARDAAHNETGLSVVGYAIARDDFAPAPDPMAWALGGEPLVINANTIKMKAATATDPSGVEYYFECTSDPAFSRIWQDDPNWTGTNFLANTIYTFRVKARDKSAQHNETVPSITVTVTTSGVVPPVSQAPTPNPMTWEVTPTRTVVNGLNGYTMTASTATPPAGAAGVEYFFECRTLSGSSTPFNSNWQASPVYAITTGINMFNYKFRVRARVAGSNDQVTWTAFSDWSYPIP